MKVFAKPKSAATQRWLQKPPMMLMPPITTSASHTEKVRRSQRVKRFNE
jgi:hypothetical protein